VGVDRFRVCELYAAGPDVEGSGSGYRLGDRLVLTARHVIAPALADPNGQVLVRSVGEERWRSARVEWQDADADAALIGIKDEQWRAPSGESVLRWGELAGNDPVPCAAVGFPWASARPDRARDTAHVYGQLAPLGQLREGGLDLDVASASPSVREGGSPWAGMSGAGVIADSHLVGVITVDPARYERRLVAVPVSQLLADEGFRDRLGTHGVPAEAAPVGGGWYLRLAGEQAVSLDPAYRPVSRRLRPAPSTLLRPEHGLVPFLGREALLNQICGWCQDLGGMPVLLVTGGGGSGKTRLGREACVQMLVAGWDAGLADDTRRDGAPTDRLQRPTLLVVDDADLRTSLISALIDYLRWDDTGPPVGLLLLARAAGAWWERLVRQQELDGAYTVVDLDHHPVPPARRAEHFRQAATAFAAYAGAGAGSAEAPPQAELDDRAYAEPLLIHIAALLRTLDTSPTPPPGRGRERAAGEDLAADEPGSPARRALLRALCERERTRWYELGEESHLSFNPDLPLADQVVALATLTAAGEQPCAMSLLAALPNQAEVTRLGAEALAVWAHLLYAGPGYWNPLRPDLLVEQHLADTAQVPALATAAARLANGQDWEARVLTQLLAELTRGAPNQPAIRAALDELLTAALSRIVDLAVTADHGELADLASLALQLAPQPDLAAQLADQMPEHSVQLAALTATLISQQVTHYRAALAGVDQNPADHLAGSVYDLARSLNDLSVRLADMGRLEEALAASEEATKIYRKLDEIYKELAAAYPDTLRKQAADVTRSDLAASLTNLAADLTRLGRVEEALAASEEAAAIYRELAAARPDAFRPGLAKSLTNLAADLADLGRREEALAASEEATAIYRELAAAHPDAFRPDLAMSLNNLSVQLGGLGRREEALAASEEAAVIYRELAAAHPDAFRPELARSLNNLSRQLGPSEDALAAIEEAVTIRRELAAAHPNAFRPDLAMSLDNLSDQLADLGRQEEALAASEEATAIYRELAAAHPDAFRPELALSLSSLSLQLLELGRREEALAASEEATAIYRELAAAHPDAFRPNLAMSLNNLAADLADLGRLEDARAASEEGTAIYQELAARWPDVYRYQLEQSLRVAASLEDGDDISDATP
jgi:tetratricopeptide (TPR) repeat protein